MFMAKGNAMVIAKVIVIATEIFIAAAIAHGHDHDLHRGHDQRLAEVRPPPHGGADEIIRGHERDVVHVVPVPRAEAAVSLTELFLLRVYGSMRLGH